MVCLSKWCKLVCSKYTLSPITSIVPLTSRTTSLLPGEFVLAEWAAAGLHVPTAVKRGLYTAHETLILKRVRQLTPPDAEQVDQSLRQWLGFA